MDKIYFRADASSELGYGHFIRTLALADMLKEDFECVFFTQSPTEYQEKEAAKVCKLIPLPSDETKFDLFLDYLTGNEIVVLDNYFFTTDYQIKIKQKGCKLVVTDDMHNQHNVADVIINHGLSDRNLFDCESHSKLCLGLDYAMLRRPFLRKIDDNQKRDNSVIICFGGADPLHLTDKVVEIVKNIKNQDKSTCSIKVILGDKTYLSEDNRNDIEVLVRLSADEIQKLFCSAYCAILSASTICIEAMYCHIPVCVGYYMDNQKEFYKSMCDAGMISPLGFIPGINADTVRHALGQIACIQPLNLDGSQIKQRYIKIFKDLC